MAVIALVLAAPVFAQTSPTYSATSGTIRSDVDNSMSVHWYGDLEFDKGFAFVGLTNSRPSLGWATKFGDTYLGLWYNGSAKYFNGYNTVKLDEGFDLVNQLPTGTVRTTTFANQDLIGVNQIQALLGLAGMGIKLGFYEDLNISMNPEWPTATVTETYNGTTITKNNEILEYSSISGTMRPSVSFGMSLPLSVTIRPLIGVSFDIFQDNSFISLREGSHRWDLDGNLIGTGASNQDQVRNNGHDSGYMRLYVNAGGDFDLSSITVGINYALDLYIYGRNYDLEKWSGSVKGDLDSYWSGYNISDNSSYTYTSRWAGINVI